MEELISRLVANVGVSEEQAQKAIEVILSFLQQSGPPDKVSELLEKMPGASDLVGTAGESGGGLLGGMGGMMGAMGAMGQLTSAGLGMGEVQGVTKEVVGYAKEHAGSELVDEIVSSIPGISQFV